MIVLDCILRLLTELSDALAHTPANLRNDGLFPVVQKCDKIAITDELILVIMQKSANLLKTAENILDAMLQNIFWLDAEYFGYVASVPHPHHICSLLHVLYLAYLAEDAEVLILQMLGQLMQGLSVIVQVGVRLS